MSIDELIEQLHKAKELGVSGTVSVALADTDDVNHLHHLFAITVGECDGQTVVCFSTLEQYLEIEKQMQASRN